MAAMTTNMLFLIFTALRASLLPEGSFSLIMFRRRGRTLLRWTFSPHNLVGASSFSIALPNATRASPTTGREGVFPEPTLLSCERPGFRSLVDAPSHSGKLHGILTASAD